LCHNPKFIAKKPGLSILIGMRKPEFFAAVFGIIKNEEWKILTVKRQNTGYMDGYYGLPAWNMEWKEMPRDAMKREILEEIWVHVQNEDLRLINITHRVQDDRVVVDYYFEVLHYEWIPFNAEPHKSEWIYWIDATEEEKIQFIESLKRIEKWELLSEIDFRNL
jgi:8-oxo-dGTP diphosphatase